MFLKLLLVLFIGCREVKSVAEEAKPENTSIILSTKHSNDSSLKCAESYCLPIDYDKLEVPFNDVGAVDVSVDLDVLQILEIDDIKFTVSFSMYFGVRWQEKRFFGPDPPVDNPYVPIDIGFVNNLWVPDVYIYHLKTIEVLNIFIPFAGSLLCLFNIFKFQSSELLN